MCPIIFYSDFSLLPGISDFFTFHKRFRYQESVSGFVIQAAGMVEFEDEL